MKGYNVYSRIQQMQEAGFSQRAIARSLRINRKTVKRYLNMPLDQYDTQRLSIQRQSVLDEYRDQIVHWLRAYPTLSAAQVCDWLKEHYSASFAERTVSRYVKALRDEYGLRKCESPRDYEAVPELPMGKQVQVDFGQMSLKNVDGGWTKVYAAAFLLARSRYKYVEMQSRPFTSADLVNICHNCFRYFGGMPQEMVFDQDSIVCVSENSGDIVYTYEFEKFRQETKVSVYMCRGADPESKGKIENTVKYVKGNFLSNRLYVDDGILNGSCLDWLERTANAKVHGTTKLIPAEVFKEECQYLHPLTGDDEAAQPVVIRTVRKDNTILFDSNRYTVPLGTFNSQPEVRIRTEDGTLYIQTIFGEPICEHRICTGRGLLIQNKSHLRDRSAPVDKLQNELNTLLDNRAAGFLQCIREGMPRYARDQFRLIQTLLDQYSIHFVLEGIAFCESNRLYSANTLKDYLEHQDRAELAQEPVKTCAPRIPVDNAKYHVTTQKRSLDDYARLGVQR